MDSLNRAKTELLIIRLRRGESEAFPELVGIWEKRLFYFIRRLVGQEEDTWDVLQETWIKAHANLRRLREPGAFPAWIYRIARHTAFSHLRREQRFELLREDNPQQGMFENGAACGFSEDQAERIHWGLDRLPLPQREALTLFFLEGFSLNEIADVARVSTGTVKSRLHYAKIRLRELLEQEDCDHE